jgi:hypothetical protein
VKPQKVGASRNDPKTTSVFVQYVQGMKEIMGLSCLPLTIRGLIVDYVTTFSFFSF